MEEIKTGLWTKTSKNGKLYYSGKVNINGQEYLVAMFDNRENKKSDKSPDFQLMLNAKQQENNTQQNSAPVSDYDGLPF